MNNQLSLSVTIKDSRKTIFDGFADAITSFSNKGKFDVLPYHANFIALIKEQVIIHNKGEKPQIIPLEAGVMKVSENTIKIVLGVETKAKQ